MAVSAFNCVFKGTETENVTLKWKMYRISPIGMNYIIPSFPSGIISQAFFLLRGNEKHQESYCYKS